MGCVLFPLSSKCNILIAPFEALTNKTDTGDVDLAWPVRAGGVYTVQTTSSLAPQTWTSLLSLYGTQTSVKGALGTYYNLRIYSAPIPGTPPPPPANTDNYAFTLRRNGPRCMVIWQSTTVPISTVSAYIDQDWQFPTLPPLSSYNVSVAGSSYTLTLVTADQLPLPTPLPPLVTSINTTTLPPVEQARLAKLWNARAAIIPLLSQSTGVATLPPPGNQSYYRIIEVPVDSDADGVKDWDELSNQYSTNPFSSDSDSDGVSDYQEILAGSDPSSADHPLIYIEGRWRDSSFHDCYLSTNNGPAIRDNYEQANNGGPSPPYFYEWNPPLTAYQEGTLIYDNWGIVGNQIPHGNWNTASNVIANMVLAERTNVSAPHPTLQNTTIVSSYEERIEEWQARAKAGTSVKSPVSYTIPIVPRERTSKLDSAWVYSTHSQTNITIPVNADSSSPFALPRPPFGGAAIPNGYRERQRVLMLISAASTKAAREAARGLTNPTYFHNYGIKTGVGNIYTDASVQACTIYYSDVVNPTNFSINDFNVELNFGPGLNSATWTKSSGPNSGILTAQGFGTASFRKPEIGGVYTFDGAFAGKTTRISLALPPAGPEMASAVALHMVRADAFAAAVTAKYSDFELHNGFHGMRWFFWDGAGDYVGRPNNDSNPTIRKHNEISDSNAKGAVVTWFGKPIRLSKLSNFLCAYTCQKIGIIKPYQIAAQRLGTKNGPQADIVWSKGMEIADGAFYVGTMANTMNELWPLGEMKEKKLWPNSYPPDNEVASQALVIDADNQYAPPKFLEMTSNP